MTDKNRNLTVRIVTALVLLPLVLYLVWLGGFFFALLLALAAGLCALELNLLPAQLPVLPAPADDADGLSRKQRKKLAHAVEEEIEELETESAVVTGAAIASIGGAFLMPLVHAQEVRLDFLTPERLIVAVVAVAFADALFFEESIPNVPRRVGMAVLGVVYPGLMISALVELRELERGAFWVLLTIVVTWLNDTGAYFTGRAFGRRRLYERISPSKTWEGAIGGAVASVAGALIVHHFWLADALPVWGAVLIGLGGAVLGPIGDLSESMLKRAFGAKDSGRLLPGHGGMLDRIDALLFTAPFVLLCARLLATPR